MRVASRRASSSDEPSAGPHGLLSHTAISLPIAFVANAIVARTIGVSGYGDLAFLTAILTLGFAVANLGFSTALIQRGSRAEAAGDKAEADSLLMRSLGFHAIVEMPILIVLALVLTHGDPVWQTVAVGGAVIGSCLLGGAALSLTIENRTAAGARLAIVSNLVAPGRLCPYSAAHRIRLRGLGGADGRAAWSRLALALMLARHALDGEQSSRLGCL